jgi:hypothetical protein
MLAAVILRLGVFYLLYQALWWHPATDAAELQAIGSAFKYVPTRRAGNEFRVGELHGPWVRVYQRMECSILGISVDSWDEEPRHGHL